MDLRGFIGSDPGNPSFISSFWFGKKKTDSAPTELNTLGWLPATNMPLLPELRRTASNEPPRVHWQDEPQNSGWGLLTELVGLLGCGIYKYDARDGARNCTARWA